MDTWKKLGKLNAQGECETSHLTDFALARSVFFPSDTEYNIESKNSIYHTIASSNEVTDSLTFVGGFGILFVLSLITTGIKQKLIA